MEPPDAHAAKTPEPIQSDSDTLHERHCLTARINSAAATHGRNEEGGFMRSLQLLMMMLLATAAKADYIFIEGLVDTELTFCNMEDDRCPAIGTPSELGGLIATDAFGNWSQTEDSGLTTFRNLDNPLIGISAGPSFIWHWFNEFDGYSWTLYFPDNTFPDLNGSGVPVNGTLVRMMQYGFLEYKVTGGFVTLRSVTEPATFLAPRSVPEPATFLLLLPVLGLTMLVRRSTG